MKLGRYNVSLTETRKRIPFQNKQGETIYVKQIKRVLTLRHVNDPDTEISFSHFTHQGKLRWRDSRVGSCTRDHVKKELGRMLRLENAEPFVRRYMEWE